MSELEEMSEFFTRRTDGYDEHMLSEVEGCKEGYELMAQLIPADCERLLDLGCGTGLELEGIFARFPYMKVLGIDLTQSMLGKAREKFFDKDAQFICGDYFYADFGKDSFGCAISFETMHHFSHESKVKLYKKIHSALKKNGRYIECDYMAQSQEEEKSYFKNYEMLIKEEKAGLYYHYDTPCAIQTQISLLECAGFKSVEQVFKKGNTVMLVAKK